MNASAEFGPMARLSWNTDISELSASVKQHTDGHRTVWFKGQYAHPRVRASELGVVAAKEAMPKLILTSTDGETKTFDVDVGATVMEIGRDELMGIEGTCGGCLSCATCHVIVDPDWFDQTGKVSDDEDEMLDMAAERTPTSRLGCQVKMTDDLDGLIVTVPNEF